ncbi:MAG: NUDIX hydrolase [Pseudomonadota bacterium]
MSENDAPHLLRYAAGIDHQVAALAWMPETTEPKFWIVTSRRTGRWVLPKGSIDAGMTAPQAAAQEAFEEVGVSGEVGPTPIGRYRIPKIRPPLIWTLDVEIYPLCVTRVDDTWREKAERERRLVGLAEAHQLIEDDAILSALRAATLRLPLPAVAT